MKELNFTGLGCGRFGVGDVDVEVKSSSMVWFAGSVQHVYICWHVQNHALETVGLRKGQQGLFAKLGKDVLEASLHVSHTFSLSKQRALFGRI